jgi:transposase-like protein
LIRCVLWLSRVAGLSAAQRREVLGALTEADADRTGAAAESVPAASPAKGAKRSRREDTLGATSHERVESQGCPHCAGREIVGWGRSRGLLRLRCKSCGRAFNALTKTPLAHLRKKERWLDHARAMIEGKSLAKTAELCGVHSDDGLLLAASVSPRARTFRGIVEADETFILESFKGRWSDLPRKARKRGGTARHPRLHPDNIPVLVARDRKGATFDAVLLQVDSASVGSALAGVVTAANHLIGDGGKAIAAFARKAGFRFTPCRRRANQPPRRLTPHQQRQCLPLPSYLGWRRALEAWGDQLAPQSGSGAPSETAHTNNERYKSQNVRELYDQQDRRLHEGACRGE